MNTTVLYIEDNEQNYYLVNFILTANGYQVNWAKDGQSGILAALKLKPNLILLDIQLPIMDGYEVAHQLCTYDELKNTPIVALTSYAMPGDRERALQNGCIGYIEKPINPSIFVNQIESYLLNEEGTIGGSSK
ncbi:MAG: response regulator [Deltaproteobacteria bacterium]|nr:response regulator [Deltaproteobacteria bacterium]